MILGRYSMVFGSCPIFQDGVRWCQEDFCWFMKVSGDFWMWSDGLGKVSYCLGKVSDEIWKVSNGAGKVTDYFWKVLDGLGKVSDSFKKESDGL